MRPRSTTVPATPRPRRVASLAALVLLPLVLAVATVAAQAPTQDPTQAATTPSDLRVDALQARIDALRSSGLPDAERDKLIEAYTRVLDTAREAEEWHRKAEQFRAAADDAPRLLAETRRQLAQLDAPDDELVASLSIEALETRLAQRRSELASATAEAGELESETALRLEKRTSLPAAIAEARRQIEEAERQLAALADAPDVDDAARARRLLLVATQRSATAKAAALDAELQSYEARTELLPLRRERAARMRARAERAVARVQSAVQEAKNDRARQDQSAAQRAIPSAEALHSALGELARSNLELTRERIELGLDIARLTEHNADATARLAGIEADFATTKKRIRAAGLTEAISLLLREQRAELGATITRNSRSADRNASISALQLRSIDRNREATSLESLDERVAGFLTEHDFAIADRSVIEARARALFSARRDYLRAWIAASDTALDNLVALDTTEKQIVAEATEYARYIDERVLWIRSNRPIWGVDWSKAFAEIAWIVDADNLGRLGAALEQDAIEHAAIVALGLLLVLALFAARRRLRRLLEAASARAEKPTCTSFAPTAIVAGLTAVLLLPWPALFALLAWRLGPACGESMIGSAVSHGLGRVTLLLLIFDAVRRIARPSGLAEIHFAWSRGALSVMRRQIWRLLVVGLPLAFVVAVLTSQSAQTGNAVVERSAFAALQIVLTVCLAGILHPDKGVFARGNAGDLRRLGHRWRWLWYALAILGPIGLLLLDLLGYHYTALRLSNRLVATLGLVVGLAIGHGLVVRALTLARRRIAIEAARERRRVAREQAMRAAAEAAQASGEPVPRDGVEISDLPNIDPDTDLASLNRQTLSFVRAVVWVMALLGVWSIWVDFLPAFGILRDVRLWTDTVSATETAPDGTSSVVARPVAITLADLLLALIVSVITFAAAKNLPATLDISILRRLPLAAGERYAIATVSGYAIGIAGIAFAFATIGIGWSKVQWLAAAVSVGLGFGLQEIFANFVSGLIILFEQPIRVGDIVTVDGVEGKVARIRMRATTIVDFDRREMVVPNRLFITSQVINWTLSDPVTRVIVPIGIAYGSDTRRARDLLLETAKACPIVLAEPAPSVVFRRFGESSLDFELRVFLGDRDRWPQLVHELHMAIDDAFRKAGIEIAFPQRDLHVRSIGPFEKLIEKAAPAADV